MAWCPKCKTDYREGFTECSDCNSALVEELEKEVDEPIEYDHEMYLTTVNDEIEADVIESLLKSSNIPVLRRYREAGAYLSIYMGNTTSGIDIYVPSKLFDVSKGLIESKEEDMGYPEIDLPSKEGVEVFDEEAERFQKSRSVRAWIVLLFFIPGVVVALLFAIMVMWNLFIQ